MLIISGDILPERRNYYQNFFYLFCFLWIWRTPFWLRLSQTLVDIRIFQFRTLKHTPCQNIVHANYLSDCHSKCNRLDRIWRHFDSTFVCQTYLLRLYHDICNHLALEVDYQGVCFNDLPASYIAFILTWSHRGCHSILKSKVLCSAVGSASDT